MDHNEERRQDGESWDLHRETVNKFIRLVKELKWFWQIFTWGKAYRSMGAFVYLMCVYQLDPRSIWKQAHANFG